MRYSTLVKIWGHFWEITLTFFSPPCHSSWLSPLKKKKSHPKKPSKKPTNQPKNQKNPGKQEWDIHSSFPKNINFVLIGSSKKRHCYTYFKMCIVLCGLVEPRWWKCLFAWASKWQDVCPGLFMVIISADLWICMLELLFKSQRQKLTLLSCTADGNHEFCFHSQTSSPMPLSSSFRIGFPSSVIKCHREG